MTQREALSTFTKEELADFLVNSLEREKRQRATIQRLKYQLAGGQG